MTELPSLPLKDVETDILTPQRAANLFYLSFRYSQGDSLKIGFSVQDLLFRYIHYLHPSWSIDEHMKKEVLGIVFPRVAKWLGFKQSNVNHVKFEENQSSFAYHISVNADSIRSVIERNLDRFKDVLTGETPITPIPRLARGIIDLDYVYLVKRNTGRERARFYNKEITPLADPFLSHLLYYGFEGNSAGAPEYDRMFTEIVEYINRNSLPLEYKDKLREVWEMYTLYHSQR